jgi:CubicO group peptidase (beta-lactamase class C family)
MLKHTFTFAGMIAAPLLALSATTAIAQDADTIDAVRMAEIVAAEADSGAFMGAVLVARGDDEVLSRAWGSADLEWGIDNTTDTKFRIGSVTKHFTSTAAFLLAEQGKLDIDAPIATYLKDTPKAWDAITVRHLMRHSAGLPNVTSLDGFGRLKYLPTSQDELIATFRDLPLEFEPGSKFEYSNSGYVLLSRIVENVSEQSLGEFFKANFFDPLGMNATGFDDSSKILLRRADGYSPSSTGRINADYVNMGIPTGAGAMYSTTSDLKKWAVGLFGGKILSEESLAEFLKPDTLDAFPDNNYAHGLIANTKSENVYYWHGGGIEGFNAWLGFDPESKTTVAVLANINGGAASKLGMDMMTLVRGGEIVLPSEREVTKAPVDFTQYEGVYALAPSFKITIFVDGDRLMAQATDQGANQIFPESEDRFFLKVVDAQIEFGRSDDGEVNALTLFQGGRELPGAKE